MLDILSSFIICLAIPIVMFLGGILIKIIKPKMNCFFGYRSRTSMTNGIMPINILQIYGYC